MTHYSEEILNKIIPLCRVHPSHDAKSRMIFSPFV